MNFATLSSAAGWGVKPDPRKGGRSTMPPVSGAIPGMGGDGEMPNPVRSPWPSAGGKGSGVPDFGGGAISRGRTPGMGGGPLFGIGSGGKGGRQRR